MTNQPHVFGLPRITEKHWDPLWHQAQDMGLSINFHIGSGDLTEIRNITVDNGRQAAYAKSTVKLFMDNSNAGPRHHPLRHVPPLPRAQLRLRRVRRRLDPLPARGHGLAVEELRLPRRAPRDGPPPPPSTSRPQCYGCFWFEEETAILAIEIMGSENFMFETDFPHPTSMSPGPNSVARNPKDHVEEVLGVLPEEDLLNVLQRNAAKVYNFEV